MLFHWLWFCKPKVHWHHIYLGLLWEFLISSIYVIWLESNYTTGNRCLDIADSGRPATYVNMIEVWILSFACNWELDTFINVKLLFSFVRPCLKLDDVRLKNCMVWYKVVFYKKDLGWLSGCLGLVTESSGKIDVTSIVSDIPQFIHALYLYDLTEIISVSVVCFLLFPRMLCRRVGLCQKLWQNQTDLCFDIYVLLSTTVTQFWLPQRVVIYKTVPSPIWNKCWKWRMSCLCRCANVCP